MSDTRSSISAALIEERTAILKIKKDGGEVPKRTDMTAPDKQDKLLKYKETGTAKFGSQGKNVYVAFRKAAFKNLKSQGILTDALFNYHENKENRDGFRLKDGYGPFDFGKKKLPENPYGLTMDECELEAFALLECMVYPGPLMTKIQETQEAGHPSLFVFDYYDAWFFRVDEDQCALYRDQYLAITFNSETHPIDTWAIMTRVRIQWESSRGEKHAPHEIMQFLVDAVTRGNMAKEMRQFMKDERREWADLGKSLKSTSAKAEFLDTDISNFVMKLGTAYEEAMKFEDLPMTVSAKTRNRAYLSDFGEWTENDEAELEDLYHDPSDPHAYQSMSMAKTPSGLIVNQGRDVDTNLTGDPMVPAFGTQPQRLRQLQQRGTRRSAPAQSAAPNVAKDTKKVTFGQNNEPRKKPLSWTDDAACKAADIIEAKKAGLEAQGGACRRRHVDPVTGKVTRCHRSHLTNKCNNKLIAQLAKMAVKKIEMNHVFHPLMVDSPIESFSEWDNYTNGVPVPGLHLPPFNPHDVVAKGHDVKGGLLESLPALSLASVLDVLAVITIGLLAYFMFASNMVGTADARDLLLSRRVLGSAPISASFNADAALMAYIYTAVAMAIQYKWANMPRTLAAQHRNWLRMNVLFAFKSVAEGQLMAEVSPSRVTVPVLAAAHLICAGLAAALLLYFYLCHVTNAITVACRKLKSWSNNGGVIGLGRGMMRVCRYTTHLLQVAKYANLKDSSRFDFLKKSRYFDVELADRALVCTAMRVIYAQERLDYAVNYITDVAVLRWKAIAGMVSGFYDDMIAEQAMLFHTGFYRCCGFTIEVGHLTSESTLMITICGLSGYISPFWCYVMRCWCHRLIKIIELLAYVPIRITVLIWYLISNIPHVIYECVWELTANICRKIKCRYYDYQLDDKEQQFLLVSRWFNSAAEAIRLVFIGMVIMAMWSLMIEQMPAAHAAKVIFPLTWSEAQDGEVTVSVKGSWMTHGITFCAGMLIGRSGSESWAVTVSTVSAGLILIMASYYWLHFWYYEKQRDMVNGEAQLEDNCQEEEKEEMKQEETKHSSDEDMDATTVSGVSTPLKGGDFVQAKRSMYGYMFWTGYLSAGGKTHYWDYNECVSSGHYSLPGTLMTWCMTMKERFFPRCKLCGRPIKPRKSNKPNLNHGCVYYSCCSKSGSNSFTWASIWWCWEYRQHAKKMGTNTDVDFDKFVAKSQHTDTDSIPRELYDDENPGTSSGSGSALRFKRGVQQAGAVQKAIKRVQARPIRRNTTSVSLNRTPSSTKRSLVMLSTFSLMGEAEAARSIVRATISTFCCKMIILLAVGWLLRNCIRRVFLKIWLAIEQLRHNVTMASNQFSAMYMKFVLNTLGSVKPDVAFASLRLVVIWIGSLIVFTVWASDTSVNQAKETATEGIACIASVAGIAVLLMWLNRRRVTIVLIAFVTAMCTLPVTQAQSGENTVQSSVTKTDNRTLETVQESLFSRQHTMQNRSVLARDDILVDTFGYEPYDNRGDLSKSARDPGGFPHAFQSGTVDLSRCARSSKLQAMAGHLKIHNAQIELAVPDTGANRNIIRDESYLFNVVNRGKVPVHGIAGAHATAMGTLRISQLNSDGNLTTNDLPGSVAVNTCDTLLLGNLNRDLIFDSWNSRLVRLNNGDKNQVQNYVPVALDYGSYAVPTYVHKPGQSISPAEIASLLRIAYDAVGNDPTNPLLAPEATSTQEPAPSSTNEDLGYSHTIGGDRIIQPQQQQHPLQDRNTTLKVVDLFCGIGCASAVCKKRGHNIIAAVDSDMLALQQYAYRVDGDDDIPLFGDITKSVDQGGLINQSQHADLMIAGVPCNNYSKLNMFAKNPDSDSKMLRSVTKLVRESQPKTLILENVTQFKTAQEGEVHERFCRECDDAGFQLMYSEDEDAKLVGSVQSRTRMWDIFVRKDVVEQCGKFVRDSPSGSVCAPTGNKTTSIKAVCIRDCLETNEVIQPDLRQFVALDKPLKNQNGTVIVAHTRKTGPRNAAYSVDHCCPTVTSGNITIYDPTLGICRFLSLKERLNCQGQGDCVLDRSIPLARVPGMIGRSMDATAIESIVSDVEAYLRPFSDSKGAFSDSKGASSDSKGANTDSEGVSTDSEGVVTDPKGVNEQCLSNAGFLSTMQQHCAAGHPGKDVSAANGIPWPKDCGLCLDGNRTKASTSSGVKPLSTVFGQTIHLDFKISGNPDIDGSTTILGATCEASNWEEIYDMKRRKDVKLAVRRLKADIRDLGGTIEKFVLDNDSVFVSKEFQDFLVEDPAQLITADLCPPYHHEYHGRQESRWKMLRSLAIKGMANLEKKIGRMKARKYWTHAYKWAKEVLNRRKFKRSSTGYFEASPYEQVKGKAPSWNDMIPFGDIVSVHDFHHHAHGLNGRRGICLGKSRQHHEKLHVVLMLDTGRIIHSIDVTLAPEGLQTAVSTSELADMEARHTISEFALPIIPRELASATIDDHDVDYITSGKDETELGETIQLHPEQRIMRKVGLPEGKRLFSPPKQQQPKQLLPVASTMTMPDKITTNWLQDKQHYVVRLNESGIEKSKSQYMCDRCTEVANHTVQDTREITVLDKQGEAVNYTNQDLVYDLNASRLYLEPAVFSPSVYFGAADVMEKRWLKEIPQSNTAQPYYTPDGNMPDGWFSQSAQAYLSFMSDVAVDESKQNHEVEITWEDGAKETYAWVKDHEPHGYQGFSFTALDKPPRSLRDVHRLPSGPRKLFLNALNKEYNGLWNRGMFRLVRVEDVEHGRPVLDTTTVFKMKFFQDGSPDRAKARVCLRGDLMREGRDFGAVFTPTTQSDSIKLMLANCTVTGKTACTFDIEQGFTYGKCDPDRPTYVKQFPGTQKIIDPDSGKDLVMQLMYRLYGDPAAPRAFHQELHRAFLEFDWNGMKFIQSTADCCVYRMVLEDESDLTSAIFVDDSCNTFVPGSEAEAAYKGFIKFLKTRFKLKDDADGMEILSSFLGMNIQWGPNGEWVRVDQPHAISKLVEGSKVDVSKPHFTPLPPKTEVQISSCPDLLTPEGRAEAAEMKSKPYRGRIGQFLWIARTSRPDIAAAVSRLASVAHNPGLEHWKLTDYLIQYIHHTRQLGLVYRKGSTDYPYGYVDVAFSPDYGTEKDNYRSFEGIIFKMAGAPISWWCRFQKVLALSSTESEYHGLTSAAKHAIHLQKLCSEMGIESGEPFLIYEDNQAAIKMSESTADTKRTIHLDRRAHFIRQKVNDGSIQLDYCPTKLMEADLMTKMMPKPGFEDLRNRMGLSYDYAEGLIPRMVDSPKVMYAGSSRNNTKAQFAVNLAPEEGSVEVRSAAR